MAYAIEPGDEGVDEALRRIAREQAERAAALARGDGPLAPRVHGMRKGVKKLRGLLRLVRPVLREARAENAHLRDAARGLSTLRDSAVRLATAEGLAEGMEERRRDALLAPFRAEAEAEAARADAAALPAFALAMDAFAGRAAAWRPRAEGWAALEPGLAATWKAARRAQRAARKAAWEDEALHEWRKRVKDHWYQARLLVPLWPGMMRPHAAAADELGELLGQANDLAVFLTRLAQADLAPDLADEARERARARRAEILDAAVPLGRRLLAEDAEPLLARWRVWWELRERA